MLYLYSPALEGLGTLSLSCIAARFCPFCSQQFIFGYLIVECTSVCSFASSQRTPYESIQMTKQGQDSCDANVLSARIWCIASKMHFIQSLHNDRRTNCLIDTILQPWIPDLHAEEACFHIGSATSSLPTPLSDNALVFVCKTWKFTPRTIQAKR